MYRSTFDISQEKSNTLSLLGRCDLGAVFIGPANPSSARKSRTIPSSSSLFPLKILSGQTFSSRFFHLSYLKRINLYLVRSNRDLVILPQPKSSTASLVVPGIKPRLSTSTALSPQNTTTTRSLRLSSTTPPHLIDTYNSWRTVRPSAPPRSSCLELRLVFVYLIFAFLPFCSLYLQSTTPPVLATSTSSHHLPSTTDAVLSAILTSTSH